MARSTTRPRRAAFGADRSGGPGQRTMMAAIALTGAVVALAAVVAIWAYWLQGSPPA